MRTKQKSVRVVSVGRPNLRAIDYVVVTIEGSSGLQASEVQPDPGSLALALNEFATDNLRNVLCFVFVPFQANGAHTDISNETRAGLALMRASSL